MHPLTLLLTSSFVPGCSIAKANVAASADDIGGGSSVSGGFSWSLEDCAKYCTATKISSWDPSSRLDASVTYFNATDVRLWHHSAHHSQRGTEVVGESLEWATDLVGEKLRYVLFGPPTFLNR